MKHLRFDRSVREPITILEALNDLELSFRQLWHEILFALTGRKS